MIVRWSWEDRRNNLILLIYVTLKFTLGTSIVAADITVLQVMQICEIYLSNITLEYFLAPTAALISICWNQYIKTWHIMLVLSANLSVHKFTSSRCSIWPSSPSQL